MNNRFLMRAGICAVFFVSGGTALIYEILWSRQFVTVFGNSAYAISIVLCAFMAGLGVGGILIGRRADKIRDPLRLYALLELGIAATALLVPWALDLLRLATPGIFALLPGDIGSVSAVRLVLTFPILFVPCLFMGGTLPVLARFCVDSQEVVGQRIGVLYGLNTLGGALGCMLAGYYLIETLGIARTGFIAVAANVTIAVAALVIRRLGKGGVVKQNTAESERGSEPEPGSGSTIAAGSEPATMARSKTESTHRTASILIVVAFLSGFTTLSCEVLWARFLAFVCHSNPYTFTAILGFFLVALALGSLIYRFLLAQKMTRIGQGGRYAVLGGVQVLIGLTVIAALLFGSWLIASSGPKAQVRLAGVGQFNQRYWWPVLNVLVFVFLPTVVMGMIFPMICAAYTRSIGAVGRSVGLIYGLNTAGCIIGSLAPVFVLIPLIGIQKSLLAIALLNGVVGMLFLGFAYRRLATSGLRRAALAAGAAGLVASLLAALLAPGNLTQTVFSKGVLSVGPQLEIVYYEEGRTGTSMVLQDKIDGLYDLYINSVNEVPTTFVDQGIFRLMGHLGPLLHPNPEEALAVCFGGGIAGGTLNLHPAVKSLDMVDLESTVIDAARVLWRENNDLHHSEKLSIIIEDGRNYLLTTGTQYPVIICDSTHPKSADSWVLYTREFYETVDLRLADPGIFIQWLPYHGISQVEYRIIVNTFRSVFPEMSLWMIFGYGEKGSQLAHSLLVAMKPEMRIDVATIVERLRAPAVAQDLGLYVMDSVPNLLRHFVCGPKTVRRWTEGLPVNTDDLPLTQYQTEYSSPPMSHHTMFIPLLESPWPLLTNVGQAGMEASDLEARLALCMQARALAMEGRWKDARDLLPTDPKLGLFEKIILKARRWKAIKRDRYTSR